MLQKWTGRAGPAIIPVLFTGGCPPPTPAPAQGSGSVVLLPAYNKSFFFFILVSTANVWYRDPRFSLPYLWGLEQPCFSTQTEVLYKTSPALLCFKFGSFPLSHMHAWEDTQRYEFIFCVVKASTLPSNHPDTKLGSPNSMFCPEQRHFPMHGMISHRFP